MRSTERSHAAMSYAARLHRQQVKEELTAAAAESAAAEGAPAKRARLAAIPAEVLADVTAVSTELSKGRKKRAVPTGTAAVEEVAEYSVVGRYPLHSTSKGGILSIDLQPGNVSGMLASQKESMRCIHQRSYGGMKV